MHDVITAADVLALDDHPSEALKAAQLAELVEYGTVTVNEVLNCKNPRAALALASRVQPGTVTKADVWACQYAYVAFRLAQNIALETLKPEDVEQCQNDDLAWAFEQCVPEEQRPPILAEHDDYDLRVWGDNPETCWVISGCRCFRGIKEALAHWSRDDDRAILFSEALIQWKRAHDRNI